MLRIQNAHAVLLAATAAAPTIAPPTAVTQLSYDAEYLNSFVENNGLNILSATSPSTDPEPLWYMDSTASLTCTFDILDLVNPVRLPEPLPIGSANGVVIYATHRGPVSAHSGPLPSSLQGKTHQLRRSDPERIHSSIEPDRAMTVGKIHYQDLHSESTSSPSTAIGDRVFFDTYPLPCQSTNPSQSSTKTLPRHSCPSAPL